MVFEIPGDVDVRALPEGGLRQRCAGAGTQRDPPDTLGKSAYKVRTECAARGQQFPHLHEKNFRSRGIRQIAHTAEAPRNLPSVRQTGHARGFQHAPPGQAKFVGQPDRRPERIGVQRRMRGVMRHVMGQKESQRPPVTVQPIGKTCGKTQRVMGKQHVRAKPDSGGDNIRRRIEADRKVKNLRTGRRNLNTGFVPRSRQRGRGGFLNK